ncbi:MAG: FtsX-like permease family protein, partial [Gammaproteobacteria bacterium]|nr:FtsX-like permease family protein [Gammaproteobacteria bacterium]
IATHLLSAALIRDAADIDLVVGAKGSPLQLVLSGLYHADIPTGNIRLSEARTWMEHPMVESAIPLSLGDSHKGFRIVGTNEDYVDIYDGQLAEGKLPSNPLEIAIGSSVSKATGFSLGATFAGQHGLDGAGHAHDEDSYTVVGIFEASDTVLDRLLITTLESVWLVHGESRPNSETYDTTQTNRPHDHEDVHAHADADAEASEAMLDDHDEGGHVEHQHEDQHQHEDESSSEYDGDQEKQATVHAEAQEITVLLVKYATPIAAITLPRKINDESALQAASPAYEITRLLQVIGIGIGWLQAFAAILVASAVLSIFAALYASLKARRNDLAVLRCLGATRSELFMLLLFEGVILTTAGIVFGLIAAHGGIELTAIALGDAQNFPFTGFVWAPTEFVLVGGLLAAGVLSSLIPSWQAFSTDVPRTLALS